MRFFIVIATIFLAQQASAVTATECYAAMQVFDQRATTMKLKVSAGEGQMGLLFLRPRKSEPNLQDKSAFSQLRKICLLAGVRKSFNGFQDDPTHPFVQCIGMTCDKPTEPSLSKVISVDEFLKKAGVK